MEILLFLTVSATILITLGLTGMFIQTQHRLTVLEKEIKSHKAELTNHKRDIHVIKTRAADRSDKIVICHEYDDKNAPSYPSKEGL